MSDSQSLFKSKHGTYPQSTDEAEEVARIVLAAISDEEGFALFGGMALRAHGITDRPTQDVDAASNSYDIEVYDAASDKAAEALRDIGYEVLNAIGNNDDIARKLIVVNPQNGYRIGLDFSNAFRSEKATYVDGFGYVYSEPDAVTHKVNALHDRGAARDFIDYDSIRRTGRWNPRRIVWEMRARMMAVDLAWLAKALAISDRLPLDDFIDRGLTESKIDELRARLRKYASEMRRIAMEEGFEPTRRDHFMGSAPSVPNLAKPTGPRRCGRCGRPISDPASVSIGLGPGCRRR